MNRTLVLVFGLMSISAQATTVSLDTSTTLLDSSTFTPGTTYFAVFQLTSSGTANTQAALASFDLGTGTGLNQSGGDPVSGNYLVGPAVLASGIWQAGGTLALSVDPLNGYALYSQAFTAGSTFQFDFNLITDLLPGATPDQFAFQLYDEGISNLLYEVASDAAVPLDAPEPGSWSLGFLCIGVLTLVLHSRRSN